MSFQTQTIDSETTLFPPRVEMRGLPPAQWNKTEKAYSHCNGLQQLFEKQARLTPQNIAVEFPFENAPTKLAYHELNTRANQLAHHLIRLGAGPDSIIGICAERSLELVVGVLAIIKAGAAYVPFDPTYPRERLRFMIEDTQAPVILTQAKLASTLPQSNTKVLCIDSEWHKFQSEDSSDPSCRVHGDNLAYLIYTSGSTGNPKAVAMRQRPLINLLQWQLENWAAPGNARCLQFASINFDVSFQEIFSTWCCGGTLVLISEEERRDSNALVDFLETNRVQRLFLPFVALKHLAESAERRKIFPKDLKEVITAGEQLQATPQIISFFSHLRNCTLENQYGPSETHVVTAYRLQGTPSTWPKLPSIGRPIANTQIHILNEQLQPVAIGESGEVFIGGVCLARGYFKRPQLTEEKFVPDPFSRQNDGRLYKTGDLARWLPEGNIEFLGRIDHQVKIRGFRIELAEIEILLSQHPSVREAVAVARESESGDKQLVAYVVPKHSVPNTHDLREFLQDRLPAYALPTSFVILPELPLSPNGKVDRKELPAPEAVQNEANDLLKKPSDPLEMQLKLLFEKLLQRRSIGVDVSFFQLGGDSLQALKLLVEIERAIGKKFPLSILYEASTVESLAKIIRKQNGTSKFSVLVPLQPTGSKPPLFLVHTTPGDLLGYGNLIFHLHADQPSYGFQSLGLEDASQAHTRVEEMASYYLKCLRHQQPKGPYILGGWCYGGIIAFEMAQQLTAIGEKVAPLLLIETPAPVPAFSNVHYYARRIFCAASMSPQRWRIYLREKFRYYFGFRTLLEQRFKRADPGSSGNVTTAEEQNRLIAQLEHLYFANLNAFKAYKARRYHEKIILFNAMQPDPALIYDPLYGWPALASEIESHVVPGTHDTILMEPNVGELAQILNKCLNQLQNSARNTHEH